MSYQQGSGGARGRGRGPSNPQQPQQGRGGGYQQGRGGGYQQGRGARGDGYYQGRGGRAPMQQVAPRPESQGRGGGRGGAPGVGPSRSMVPDLHQATGPLYQASHPAPLQASSSSHAPAQLAEQFQHISVQDEAPVSQATQLVRAAPSSSKSLRSPLRPGLGTVGVKCIVKANHFLAKLPDKDLYKYDVAMKPESTSRGVNRAVMEQLVKLYRGSHLGGRLPAYDGRKGLYTAGELPFQSQRFVVPLLDEEDAAGSQTQRRKREFEVTISYAARADLHQLGLFLAGKQAECPQDALQVLDIVLRELPTSKYTPVGRSFYSPLLGRTQQLGDGLESWRGFYQSIRPTQMGLSLNLDMSSSAFIEPLNVKDFVSQLLGRDLSAGPFSDAERVKIKKALRGLKVEVTHRGNMRRKYRISGLTSQPTRDLVFPIDEQGTMKSVVHYFQETYAFTIQLTALPCLQAGNQQRPNYLPMEVCKIVEGQRYSKRLNDKQITALLKVTCQRPLNREQDIVQTVHRNAYMNDSYAKEFGISISEALASVDARILPAPWLKYHDSGREKDCLPKVGQWNMMNRRMFNGGRVSNWICINFSRNVQQRLACNFCYKLADMCNVSGMDFAMEPVVPVLTSQNIQPAHVVRVLKSQYCNAMNILKPQGKEVDLLIVVLPDNNGSLYGELKRICETDLGLVSQCCLTKHVQSLQMLWAGEYLLSLINQRLSLAQM